MGKKLNIQQKTIQFGTVTDLLNGAFSSLNGPVGFTPTQHRIIVKMIRVVNDSENPVSFVLSKGLSGKSLPGTRVLSGNVLRDQTLSFDMGLVLDAEDFLTGTCTSNTNSGGLTVNISAEIEF